MTDKSDEKLHPLRAIVEAIRDRPINYFPRVRDDEGRITALSDTEAIRKVSETIAGVKSSAEVANIDEVLKLARQSLDEVTSQTDYQDGKATRLLTIVTFLSAFSGLLFNRVADNYPLSSLSWASSWDFSVTLIVVSCYLGFAFFAFFAVSGALVTFHAIRARFRYPNEPAENKPPKSLLFYQAISRTQPAEWGKAFLDKEDASKVGPDLRVEYLKNYVVETYLIAAKVADKLRFLQPAQKLQSLAITTLIFWLVFVALLFAFVSPLKKESNSMIRAVVTPTSSSCIIGGNDVSAVASLKQCSEYP